MTRILITYYSRSAHTREVAEYAALRSGAVLEPIVEVTARRGGFWGDTLTTLETLRGQPSQIRPIKADPTDFDIVLIGTQVWAGSLNPPAKAYIASRGAQLGRYGLFCTLGGMGAERAFGQFAALVGRAPERTLAIRQSLLKGQAYREVVDAFLDGL